MILLENTDHKTTKSILLKITMFGCAAVFLSATPTHSKIEKSPIKPMMWVTDSTSNKFDIQKSPKITNKTELYRYMKSSGIKFPELVWSQAMVESGNMNSDLFNRSNNLFGMTKSEIRPHVQIHIKGDRYSHFKSVKKCVIDYSLHQQYVMKVENIKTEYGYIKKLIATGYAADKNNSRKILAVRNNTDFKSMLE